LAGKERSFLKVAILFFAGAQCKAEFHLENAFERKTSIIGKKGNFPNYSVPIFIGGDIGVDK